MASFVSFVVQATSTRHPIMEQKQPKVKISHIEPKACANAARHWLLVLLPGCRRLWPCLRGSRGLRSARALGDLCYTATPLKQAHKLAVQRNTELRAGAGTPTSATVRHVVLWQVSHKKLQNPSSTCPRGGELRRPMRQMRKPKRRTAEALCPLSQSPVRGHRQ